MKDNNCYIRNKVGCHCTDTCAYEGLVKAAYEEDSKPDWLDPYDIAETIFYSPATNGKSVESLERGAELIRAYAKQEKSDLESQLDKAKELLCKAQPELFRGCFNQIYREIESFLKS